MKPSIARFPSHISFTDRDGLVIKLTHGRTDATMACVYLGLGLLMAPFSFADPKATQLVRLLFIGMVVSCLFAGLNYLRAYFSSTEIVITPKGFLSEKKQNRTGSAVTREGQILHITSLEQATRGIPNQHIFAVLTSGEKIFLFTYNQMAASLNKRSEQVSDAIVGLRKLKVSKTPEFNALLGWKI